MIDEWARRWCIPLDAIDDLRQRMVQQSAVATGDGSESAVSQNVRLEASRAGARLWRNNVGAGKLDNGSFVRWGLANESAAMNERIKSGDLIGIRPILITPEHVGKVIGQFVSRECKRSDWHYSGKGREVAQMHWCEIVTVLGGDAKFTNRGF